MSGRKMFIKDFKMRDLKQIYHMSGRAAKGKGSRKIEHEIFILCAEVENIQYWISLFTNCAYGKFPRGISYKNGVMYLKQRKKKTSKSYRIPTSAPEARQVVKKIFQTDIGMLTKNEYMEARIRTKKLMKAMVPRDDPHWSHIKSPIVRNRMLSQFAHRRGKKLNLTREGRELLERSINIGLICGTIKSDDIIIEGIKIVDIIGLESDSAYYVANVKQTEVKKVKQARKRKPQINLNDDWAKYCKQFVIVK